MHDERLILFLGFALYMSGIISPSFPDWPYPTLYFLRSAYRAQSSLHTSSILHWSVPDAPLLSLYRQSVCKLSSVRCQLIFLQYDRDSRDSQ
jgi:hypothetical protein